MYDLKKIKESLREITAVQGALTASVRGFEGACRASDDALPEAARLLVELMASRAADLIAAVKTVDGAVRALQKEIQPVVDQQDQSFVG